MEVLEGLSENVPICYTYESLNIIRLNTKQEKLATMVGEKTSAATRPNFFLQKIHGGDNFFFFRVGTYFFFLRPFQRLGAGLAQKNDFMRACKTRKIC